MKKLLVGLCAVSALVGVSGFACAADEGFYAGAGMGQSATTISSAATGVSSTFTATAFNVMAGYSVNKNFAVEAGYVDMGKFVGANADIALAGFGVSAVGSAPLSDSFSLYGKVGVASITSTASAHAGFVLLVPASQSKTGLSFGFGGQYNVTPTAAIRAGVDSYQYEAFSSLITGRVAVYGVSGVFKF